MMRVLKLVLAALIIGACMAVTPSALAFACDQMFTVGNQTCFLSGEDEQWCYYNCYMLSPY
jgi:hypothetical protein